MLLKQKVLDGIAAGKITLAFRCWKRPSVKTGGTLKTSIGVLAIDAVERVEERDIKPSDVAKAGFSSLEELLEALHCGRVGDFYRIRFHLAGPDPRIALREQAELSLEEIADLKKRLARFDAGPHGAWTARVLKMIARRPGLRAADLAKFLSYDKERLKNDVCKLKNLGLTESLQPGYKISPRGEALLRET